MAAMLVCATTPAAPAFSATEPVPPEAPLEQPALAADEGASAANEADNSAPALPFNGTDALVLMALALSLLAAGFALRRFSTR